MYSVDRGVSVSSCVSKVLLILIVKSVWGRADSIVFFFFFQAEDGIRDKLVTGVQTCALPISRRIPSRTAKEYGVPVLGEIEIDPRIRIGGDTGKPVALGGESAPAAKSIYAMARAVTARLEKVGAAAAGPAVQID